MTARDGFVAWLGDGLRRVDLRSGELRRFEPLPSTAEQPSQGFFVAALVLGDAGRTAWLVKPMAAGEADQLNGLAPDGSVVTVATGPGTLFGPLISADGLTVTWREAGVERSAPMP